MRRSLGLGEGVNKRLSRVTRPVRLSLEFAVKGLEERRKERDRERGRGSERDREGQGQMEGGF